MDAPVNDTVSEFQPVHRADHLLYMLHFWYTHDHQQENLNDLMRLVSAYLGKDARKLQ